MRDLAILLLLLAAAIPGMQRAVEAQPNEDARLTHIRDTGEGNHFSPPRSKETWNARRRKVRERILVSCGLFPLPERTALHPQVYGKIERDGYTIEKVVLETLPGFYLAGNLYRPTRIQGKVPGILNPHGHWPEGRFTPDIQARCIGQARMGAVAFMYDMVGYGDSKPFGHAFMDAELASTGLNLAGLQLWDSIRALDWLLTLPEVDPARIACTGESGGGTQTFLLSAVEDRIAVSAPVCMVSSHYQGGCTCENVPDLRVDTDNVEFAACFAPKPQLLVGATGDWTKEIQQHGVPEIRAVYRLYGAEQNLLSVVHDAPHNYNQASRESVYTFFKRFLWHEPNAAPVKEAAYTAETPEALSVWDAEHARPKNIATPEELKRYLSGVVSGQISTLRPITGAQWRWASDLLQTALETQLGCEAPKRDELVAEAAESSVNDAHGYRSQRVLLTRRGSEARTTAILLTPELDKGKPGVVTVLVHPAGARGLLDDDGAPGELVSALLRKGERVLLVNPFLAGQTGEIARRQAAQFYSTYNRTVLGERVQDILNGIAYADSLSHHVNLVGLEEAGPWVLLARPLASGIRRTAADASGWEWPVDLGADSEMWLPGARRYGGMKAYTALCAPDSLFLYNHGTNLDVSWVEAAYKLEGVGDLRLSPFRVTPETVAAWICENSASGGSPVTKPFVPSDSTSKVTWPSKQ